MRQIKSLLAKDSLSQVDQLSVGMFEGESLTTCFKGIDPRLTSFATSIAKKEGFKGSCNQSMAFYFQTSRRMIRVVVLGLGKKQRANSETAREAVGKAVLMARGSKIKSLGILIHTFFSSRQIEESECEAVVEAAELALYRFKGYRKANKDNGNGAVPSQVFLVVKDAKGKKAVEKGSRTALALTSGVMEARDLINEPSNKMNPQLFCAKTKEFGKKYGFQVKVLEQKDLEREKMGALLAVGQGSHIPPRLAVLIYNGKTSGQPVCVVGKGITFDTGGISLKSSKDMDKMKYDMSGGAAVVGVITSAAKLKLPVRLVGLVPLAENMPDGKAVKPGDIIHSAAGLSIEVLNTDAEGRLVLADALHYAKRFKPKAVFDMATLTGAVIVALGSRAIGAMGDSALIKKLQDAGEEVNERVWELPMWSEYDEDVKSEVADIQNIGKGEAGTIMGAKFLEPFVGKAYPWVHLDIAGTAWVERKAPSYCPKGGRGVGVRLLIQYLRTLK